MVRWSIVTLLGLCLVGQASGQPFGRSDYSPEGTLIEAPREVSRLLTEARNAIATQSWTEATYAIGFLLGIEEQASNSDAGYQDYFYTPSRRESKRVSLRDEAMRLIEEIPEAGMKVFELRYGVVARQLMDEALVSGDWRKVARVARDYSATQAGRDAAWLLAESRIYDGNPGEAALLLQRLLRQSRGRNDHGIGGFVLQAVCWKAAGHDDLAVETLKEGQSFFPQASIIWGDKTFPSSTSPDELLEELDLEQITQLDRREKMAAWVGGRADRNGNYPAGVPLPLINWHYPLHESDQNEISAERTIKQKLNDKLASFVPSRSPLIVPPWVIAMSYDQRINAIHLRTGKLMWTPSLNRIPLNSNLDRFQTRESGSWDLPIADHLLRRIWGEAANGQLSSDGKLIFSIAELPSSDASDNLLNGANARVVRPLSRSVFNVLQAFSIEAQGKLVWEVGGETGLADSELANVLFLGTPLAYDNDLLIIGELNGEVYLFGLSPEDGSLRWRQQLVANQSVQLAQDNVRRNMTCSPAVAENQVICPTLSGQLVALDLGSRTLRWAHRYEQSQEVVQVHQFNPWGSVSSSEFHVMGQRSAEGSVIISDGTVIHAPCDSRTVYAIDLLTGKKLWEQSPSAVLYVGGIWEKKLLLVQNQSIQCLDVRTGKPVWKEPTQLDSIGHVAGRGVRNGSSYFLPMVGQVLLEIDIKTGAIVDRMHVKEPLGNLASTTDQIISLSPMALTAYSIRDRLRAEIDMDFAADKNATGRLQREGKILLAEGKTEEALTTIEKAYDTAPDDPEIRLLLKEVALMALQQDFQKYASRVAKYEHLIKFGPERAMYMVSVIEGFLRQGRYVEGVQQILSLSERSRQNAAYGSSMIELVEPETGLQSRQDIWAATKLAQLYYAADPISQSKIEALIRPEFDSLLSKQAPRDYERRSELFRWLPFARDLRMADAERTIQERDWLLAEQIFEELLEVAAWDLRKAEAKTAANGTDETPLAAIESQVDTLRLRMYPQANRWLAAVPAARRRNVPIEELAKTKPSVGSISSDSSATELTSVGIDRLATGTSAWPNGKIKVEEKAIDQRLNSFSGVGPCSIRQRVGDVLNGWTITFAPNSIDLSSPDGNQRISSSVVSRSEGIPAAAISAHLIDSIAIIETQSELIAMDTLRAAQGNRVFAEQQDYVLWRESFARLVPTDSNASSRSLGQGFAQHALVETKHWGEKRPKNRKGFSVGPVSRTGILVATNNSLICFDPRTGSRRWVRSGVGDMPTLAIDGFHVIVMDSGGETKLILDGRDGSLINRSEWNDGYEVWCTQGKYSLSTYVNRRKNNALNFRLTDVVTGEVVLSREFVSSTRIDVHEYRRLVALNPLGELIVWDLANAKESTYKIDVPKDLNIERVQLERFGESLLVMTECTRFKGSEIVRIDDTDRFRRCSGPVIAIDYETGEPLWEKPVMLYDFALPISLVRSSPLLCFVRSLRFKAGGELQTETGSLTLIDIRNGKLAYANNYLMSERGTEFQSLLRPEQGEVMIQYRGTELLAGWDAIPAADEDSSDEFLEIGKVTKEQLERETPKEFMERLQSRDADGDGFDDNSDGLFGIPRR